MTDDLNKYFRIEGRELVDRLGQDLLTLDSSCTPEIVGRLLRYAHTLKGAARVVKQLEMAEGAHTLEGLLAPHRARVEPLDREQVERMLAVLHAIDEKLRVIERPVAAPHAPPDVAAPAPSNAAGVPTTGVVRFPSSPASDRTVRADIGQIDQVVDALGASLAELHAVRGQLGRLDELRELAEGCLRQLTGPQRVESRLSGTALEHARALADELSAGSRSLEADLATATDRMRRELESARAQAEQLRLAPARSMFASLERAARDAARDLDKEVHVATSGGDTRLDSSVLEIVQAALFHVVRNAVAHGIEPRQVRLTRGKPAVGTIAIEVARAGPRVAFRCRDDGAGLDVDAIRRALQHSGTNVTPLPELGSEQLLELLLRSGVSTSARLSAVSGRGVGLDVLREATQRLNGRVRFDSRPGIGLTVELEVPLSVAAMEALRVESDGQPASLPLDAVRRSVRVASHEIATGTGGDHLVHDGVAVPYLPLSAALRGAPRQAPAGTTTAVIVHTAVGAIAVGVDRVLGTRTVLLRKLPALLPPSPLLAGAALDALGNPEIVLDPDGLYAEAQRPRERRRAGAPRRLPVLVVDDSLTTRMLEQSILESAGYRVTLASSAEEALQKARAAPHGLFLVDVEMPGMNGFEFVEQIQRDPELRHIPAVLVSSRDAPEDLQRGEAAGARGYIVKGSFDQRELLGLIGKLLVRG